MTTLYFLTLARKSRFDSDHNPRGPSLSPGGPSFRGIIAKGWGIAPRATVLFSSPQTLSSRPKSSRFCEDSSGEIAAFATARSADKIVRQPCHVKNI